MNTQAIIVLSLSFPFELVGEPPERVHPTALIGRLELKLEALLRRKSLFRNSGVLLSGFLL